MSKTNKYISADIKKQILERLRNDGIPVAQLAEEHGISNRTIYGWLSKGATSQPTWLELNKLKRENQALKELIGKITYEMSVAQKKS